jgi:hypothetical protein
MDISLRHCEDYKYIPVHGSVDDVDHERPDEDGVSPVNRTAFRSSVDVVDDKPSGLRRADAESHSTHCGDADERSGLPLSKPRTVQDPGHQKARRDLDEVEHDVVERPRPEIEVEAVQRALQCQCHLRGNHRWEQHHELDIRDHMPHAEEFVLDGGSLEDCQFRSIASDNVLRADEKYESQYHSNGLYDHEDDVHRGRCASVFCLRIHLHVDAERYDCCQCRASLAKHPLDGQVQCFLFLLGVPERNRVHSCPEQSTTNTI